MRALNEQDIAPVLDGANEQQLEAFVRKPCLVLRGVIADGQQHLHGRIVGHARIGARPAATRAARP